MPRITARLADTKLRNAQAKDKPYKLHDGEGLFLLVRPTGKKVWQMLYQHGGKHNTYTIGPYPDIGAADARKIRDDIKAQLREGTDPNKTKQTRRLENMGQSETNFETIAREWLAKQVWVEKHKKNITRTFEADVFPKIGYMQIDKIMPKDMLVVLKPIEARGALDVAKRVNQHCSAVFDYAIVQGLCEMNPAHGRSKFLKSYKTQHRPRINEDYLPAFLNELDDYSGSRLVQLAMKLLILTFVRPGELRNARWIELDEDKAIWRIPAERMKMKRDHAVPLSKQALEIIRELRTISGKGELVFPGWKNVETPISDVTLTKVLRIMGYDKKNKKHVVPSGFRATASTILNEKGFNRDAIERQLAHVEEDRVRAAYHHSEYMEVRKEMMQWYADHLDELKASYQGGIDDK